jgi:hypothetical protein
MQTLQCPRHEYILRLMLKLQSSKNEYNIMKKYKRFTYDNKAVFSIN